ncbi:UDP-glucuronosyl/UDP-glucosyltransferase protein [Dioscorea alata]|uniref:UDP-glucuronosyl/UDP-glucosyltransferase protein n=1 Tax=Dioscorea alata TaxID=55571 RepID=A0ACB7VGM0_DIOAL|nr:UDP-glucuronosyl/UDP-glucosyltransferase protein [Dioscorea alata]
MENTSSSSSAAHVLIIPFPAQGHVTPMLSLAKLLSFSGVFTTFVNTESIHRRLSGSSGLNDSRRLRFRAVPDPLTGDGGGNKRDFDFPSRFFDLQESMRKCSTEAYKKLLTVELAGEWPPVTCVIADGILDYAIEVAGEIGIPTLIFRTSSPCGWAFASLPSLIHHGIIPFSEECDMDEIIKGVEGMDGILRRRDLPGYMRMVKSTEDNHIKLMNGFNTKLINGKAIIFNSFDALDPTILPIMSAYYPSIFNIGPLHLLSKFFNISNEKEKEQEQEPGKNSCSSSLRQEDHACMTWLDNQPDKSVVYVCFGSVAVMSLEQFIEFWHGLVNSGHRFLWAVREDLVKGKEEMEVTKEMEEGTKERGCMVKWVSQKERY